MALPPCHLLFQCYVAAGRLSCQLYQRRRRPLPGRALQHRQLRAADPDAGAGGGPGARRLRPQPGRRAPVREPPGAGPAPARATPRTLPTLVLDPSVKDLFESAPSTSASRLRPASPPSPRPSPSEPGVRLSLIAAVAENGVIGRDGGMPWRLPEDQRFFKRLTTGHTLVMGRKTFEFHRPAAAAPHLDRAESPHRQRGTGRARRGHTRSGAGPGGGPGRARGLRRGRRRRLRAGAPARRGPVPDAGPRPRRRRRPLPDFEADEWKLVAETPHPAAARHAHAFTLQEFARG